MCEDLHIVRPDADLKIFVDEAKHLQNGIVVIGLIGPGKLDTDELELLLAQHCIGNRAVIVVCGPVLPLNSADTDKVEYTHTCTFKSDEPSVFDKMAAEFDKTQKQMELDIERLAKLSVEFERLEIEEKPINYEIKRHSLPVKPIVKQQSAMLLKRTGCRGK